VADIRRNETPWKRACKWACIASRQHVQHQHREARNSKQSIKLHKNKGGKEETL
jgi:hypothetical protein